MASCVVVIISLSISHVTKGFITHFGMIFNKAHVAFARHRLGECHIPVALKIMFTQTVDTLISRRTVWCMV